MQEIIIGKNEGGQRLDKFLKKALPGAGTSLLYKQLRKKNITLNKTKADGSEILNQGDAIQFFFSDETYSKFRCMPETGSTSLAVSEYQRAYEKLGPISILYESDDILILDKPAGVLSQKSLPSDLSVNEWMIGYLLSRGKLTEEDLKTFHPSVCNRLDRNTSGLVLCGKSLAGSQVLSKLIRDRKVRKFYRTVCYGALCEEQTIRGFLKKDPKTNKVTVLSGSHKDEGDRIETRYLPIALAQSHQTRFTYLEVELITGKPHQIRAHLNSVGHALVGDHKYGKTPSSLQGTPLGSLRSQLLHASFVLFPKWESVMEEYAAYEEVLKPLSGRQITSPLPADFIRILKWMGLNGQVDD